MPIRLMHYVACFYDHLLKNGTTTPHKGLPPILPIVLYNIILHGQALIPLDGILASSSTIGVVRCVWVCIIVEMDSKDLIKKLQKQGWELVAVKGSHHQFKHPAKSGRVTVPHPKRDLPKGTVNSIIKQAGLKQGRR